MTDHGMNRRRFLGAAAAFGAAAWGASVFRFRGVRPLATDRPLTPAPETPNAAGLVGELVPGYQLERWAIERVRVTGGAICVVMKTGAGESFQVDVLARDDAAPGVAQTRSLSLYLVNGGNGRTASVEEHGLGAMTLAHFLDRREAAGAKAPKLYTLRERGGRPDKRLPLG